MKNLMVITALAALPFVGIAQNTKTKQGLDIATFENKLKEAGANAQILDARTEEEFYQNHLKDAISLSATEESEVQKQLDKLDKQKPVFVYSIGNGRSGRLATKLSIQGFKEVYELPGGISNWIGSKRPVESTVSNGLTVAEYKKRIASDKLVLVDVSSRYCGACKKLAPIVDSIARENEGKIKVVKVEFFDNKELAQALNVNAIPALFLYKGYQIVWQKVGITPKKEIQTEINNKSIH